MNPVEQARHDLELARKTVAKLERRLALLTAALPVTHDLTHPGEPIQLVADQQTQDEADGNTPAQPDTQPHDSPQPEQPDQHPDQQPTA